MWSWKRFAAALSPIAGGIVLIATGHVAEGIASLTGGVGLLVGISVPPVKR